MVDNVVHEQLETGMKMDRVQALLGPPDEVAGHSWLYHVDFEHTTLFGDCVSLELKLRDGRLRHAAVVRDG